MKNIITISFIVLTLQILNAGEIKPKRLVISTMLCPEWNYYKSNTDGLRRKDKSEMLGLGLGMAGINSAWNYGLGTSFGFSSRFLISTGFFESKTGSTIEFNKPTTYYYNSSTGFTPIESIDSSYGLKNANISYYHHKSRKYSANYFMVPLSFCFNVLPAKSKFKQWISIGIRFYRLRNASSVDFVEIVTNNKSSYKSQNTDISSDMNKVLIAITAGIVNEVYLNNEFSFLWGLELGKGLSNPVKTSSNYLMDENKSLSSFKRNGNATPLLEDFKLNTITLNLGISYSIHLN